MIKRSFTDSPLSFFERPIQTRPGRAHSWKLAEAWHRSPVNEHKIKIISVFAPFCISFLLFFDSDEYGHDAHSDAVGDIGLQRIAKCKLSTQMNRANAGQANQWCQEFRQVGLFSRWKDQMYLQETVMMCHHSSFVFQRRTRQRSWRQDQHQQALAKKRCCPVRPQRYIHGSRSQNRYIQSIQSYHVRKSKWFSETLPDCWVADSVRSTLATTC